MAANDPRILCPDVIGRNEELAALSAHLRSVTADTGRMVLIAGEAGLGKSALLRAFTRSARAADVRVLTGECSEVEAKRPFGPFVQILRSAKRVLPAGALERSIRENASELARLVPELDVGVAHSEAVNPAERYRIHESFASLLRDLASRAELVVAVEDLHWADEASLELLPFLANRLRAERILLVATYRPEGLAAAPLLERALADLDRGRLAERISLSCLDLAGTAAVVRKALGLDRPAPADLVAAVHARCEGNPFFIEEVLKTLAERGDLHYEAGSWRSTKAVQSLALPDSVRVAVEQRTHALSPVALHAIQVAAVIGQRFDFDLLRVVSGATEAELIAALRLAIDAQLIVDEADSEADQRYSFRHALTREAVQGQLLQREQRLLHRAVGEALEAHVHADPSRHVAELAYHFDEAGDVQRARRYHEGAGAQAHQVFAFARELRHLERALELAPDDTGLGQVHLLVAEAAFLSGELRRGAGAATDAARLFEKAGDPGRAGTALFRAARCYLFLGEGAECDAALTNALRLLEPLGASPSLGDVYAWLAAGQMMLDNGEGAIALGERAIAVGRSTDATRAEVGGLLWLGAGILSQGRDGLPQIREALALAVRGELVFEAEHVSRLFQANMELGPALDGEAALLRADRLRRAQRYGYRPSSLIDSECHSAFGSGDWDQALEFATEPPAESTCFASCGLVSAFIVTAREGPEHGLRLLEEPRRRLLAASGTGPELTAIANAAAVALALLAGDPSTALEHAEPVAEILATDFWSSAVSYAAICAITAARELGDAAALERWIDLALTDKVRRNSPHARARRAFARAERSVAAGELDAAIASLGECNRYLAAVLFGPTGFLPATFVHLRRAELLLQRAASGDRKAAGAELAADLPQLSRGKATWYLSKLREWADERELPFPPDSTEAGPAEAGPMLAGGAQRLTAREREVAVLVARGSSNREIAEKLGISDRTAEGHVEQVRNKLGFHSRAQIAAWVADTMPGSYREATPSR